MKTPAANAGAQEPAGERTYRRFVESLTERYFFFAHDRFGRFTYLSPSISQVLGYSPDEYRAHYGEMLTAAPINTEAYLRSERALAGETQGPYEIEVKAKDGSLHRLEITEHPVLDGDGQVEGLEGIARDITDKWRAEEALRESEEKYRSFFEENLAGHYVSTPDGTLLACNRAFARIIGFESAAEATAASLWSLYPSPEARASFVEHLRREGRLETVDLELKRQDGAVRWVVENAVGKFDERGELVEIHGFIMDQTERTQAEHQLRQAQKIEAVGQLAGGMAHDFNNLLGVVIGYCELLQEGLQDDPRKLSLLGEIRKAADRATSLTRQLLAFSRLQVLEPRVLDLNAVVTDVGRMLQRLIGENIELATELEPELGRVTADPGQLEQVILNLAINARDAMPHGGRLVIATANVELDEQFVRALSGSRAGPHVMLTLSDNGQGMDAATLARIFEPFFTTKPKPQGTGLGLSTVYGIVKQSGGYIWVESEPGAGSTFRIYLPRAEGALEARPWHQPAAGSAPGGEETILLLEDEDALRQGIAQILERAGYTVIQCGQPSEALAVAGSDARPIDLVLTDVVMPQMNGPQAVAQILEARPGARVLYMSGYTDDAIARHGVLEPGVALIAKPFSAAAVLSKIREVLDRE